MKIKDVGCGLAIVVGAIIIVFGVGTGISEIKAHYEERAFLFEWEHNNRQIGAVLDSIEQIIRIIKE